MKKFLYKNRILLFIIAIPYLLIVISGLIRINYDVTAPANISSIDDVITIDGQAELDGSINVVSVYSFEKVSILGYLIGQINPYANVTESVEYTDVSYDDMMSGGIIDKRTSIYNAIIAGYKYAGYENIKYDFRGYIIDALTTYADKDLAIGDRIISVNGTELTNDYSIQDYFSDFSKNNSSSLDKPYTFMMSIIKEGQTKANDYEITGTIFEDNIDGKIIKSCKFGFNAIAYNIPSNSSTNDVNDPLYYPKFTTTTKYKSIGPSGGLLQSFYVYEKLTGAKLSKGLTIAGTGTVDINGNAGLIGGIEQKIITSELSGVDVFFIPVTSPNYLNNPTEINYIDAINAYEKLNNPHMKIYPVWSLESLIDALKDYRGR